MKVLKGKFDGGLTVWARKAMHGANCQACTNQLKMKCVVDEDKHHDVNDRAHGRTHSILIDC